MLLRDDLSGEHRQVFVHEGMQLAERRELVKRRVRELTHGAAPGALVAKRGEIAAADIRKADQLEKSSRQLFAKVSYAWQR